MGVIKGNTYVYVTKQTRQRLRDLGKKGETYDVIISRLLDKAEAEK